MVVQIPGENLYDLEAYDYDLPEELIAQEPLPRRDEARLLVVRRREGTIEHSRVRELPRFLPSGDVLVLNDTRVIPARLLGHRAATGGSVEVLLLQRLDELPGDQCWEALVRPARRIRCGEKLVFEHGLYGTVLKELPGGRRVIRFDLSGSVDRDVAETLEKVGQVPLPPYIRRPLDDPDRYQTIYARKKGSAAAPTAGLHFTEELLSELESKGVGKVFVTLHVGPGTFRPVRTEDIRRHKMHEEWYHCSEVAARQINEARQGGHRCVAVGTTVARNLETLGSEEGTVRPGGGVTDLFIYPGYRWKVVDVLLTNFHLPRSTLLMLVCAFGGRDLILQAYREAIERRYRFYSLGDAMLIL